MKTFNEKNNNTEYQLVSKNELIIDDQEDLELEHIIDPISMLSASRVSIKSLKNKNKKKEIEEKIDEEEIKEEKNNAFKTFLLNYRGSLLALSSAFISSIMIILIKKTYYLSATELALIRYLSAFTINFIMVLYKKLHMFGPKKFRKVLFLRGSLGVVGMICSLFALSFIKPSDSIAIVQ